MTKKKIARANTTSQQAAPPKGRRRRKQPRNRRTAAPAIAEIRGAVERVPPRSAGGAGLTGAARADLAALLTGGLWTHGDELRAEDAASYVVAAQLKALLLALANTESPGWCLTEDELTDEDIAAVLSGAVAMLASTRRLIPELRERGALLDSLDQWGERAQGGAL
jgi:hypothetical protein